MIIGIANLWNEVIITIKRVFFPSMDGFENLDTISMDVQWRGTFRVELELVYTQMRDCLVIISINLFVIFVRVGSYNREDIKSRRYLLHEG